MVSTLRIAHETKKAHERLINLQTGQTSPPVSTQLQHRSAPFPPNYNQLLATTGWLLSGVLPATYEMQGNREHREENTCCLKCCQSGNPQTCSDKNNNITTWSTTIATSRGLPDEQVHTQRCHVPENCGRSFPMKGVQYSHTTKSGGCSQQVGTAS